MISLLVLVFKACDSTILIAIVLINVDFPEALEPVRRMFYESQNYFQLVYPIRGWYASCITSGELLLYFGKQ